jgi:hypothetical protein
MAAISQTRQHGARHLAIVAMDHSQLSKAPGFKPYAWEFIHTCKLFVGHTPDSPGVVPDADTAEALANRCTGHIMNADTMMKETDCFINPNTSKSRNVYPPGPPFPDNVNCTTTVAMLFSNVGPRQMVSNCSLRAGAESCSSRPRTSTVNADGERHVCKHLRVSNCGACRCPTVAIEVL